MVLTRVKIALAVISLAVIGIGYAVVSRRQVPTLDLVAVSRRDVTQTVSVTGQVKPAERLQLGFEGVGTLVRLLVDTGDHVSANQLLATLDTRQLEANQRQAAAALEQARAELQRTRRGARAEEIQVRETAVANAVKSLAEAERARAATESRTAVALDNLYRQVPDVVQDAYVTADDAVNKQTEGMFTELTNSWRLTFTVTNAQTTIDVETQRGQMETVLATLRQLTAPLPTDDEARDRALNDASDQLASVRLFLNRLHDALNDAGNITTTTQTTYRASVNTARTNVNVATTAISKLQQSIASQRATNQADLAAASGKVTEATNALRLAEGELALTRAAPTVESIAVAEAAVTRAEAALQSATVQLEQAHLRAPLNGVVTERTAEVGERISAQQTVLALISDAALEIEANIPEIDIGKIALGNDVHITLDAFPHTPLLGKVTFIDPAETTTNGVVNYRTKVGVDAATAQQMLKSGLTANLEIRTAYRRNVLALPSTAVTVRDGLASVRKVVNGQPVEERVTLGVNGTDGYIEIADGVTEGDRIVNVGTATKP